MNPGFRSMSLNRHSWLSSAHLGLFMKNRPRLFFPRPFLKKRRLFFLGGAIINEIGTQEDFLKIAVSMPYFIIL